MGPIRVLNNTPDRYTCGGYPANRAPLSFDEGRSRSMTVEEFSVTVTLTDQVATDRFMIEVKHL
ncbi:NACHT nucleoside triphosphatase [Apiospora arundinis]